MNLKQELLLLGKEGRSLFRDAFTSGITLIVRAMRNQIGLSNTAFRT